MKSAKNRATASSRFVGKSRAAQVLLQKAVVEVMEPRVLLSGYALGTVVSFIGDRGAEPIGGVAFDGNGNLFGTTFVGGANGLGTVFEIPKNSSTATTIASFNGTNGSAPKGTLNFDSSGNLFGTTTEGGANGLGTVFEIVKNSTTIQAVASFTGANGSGPFAGVTFDAAGNIFGTTETGGANDKGTVFEIVKGSTTINTIVSFNGTNGSDPTAVTFDSAGNLFGTTATGGANAHGTVYEIAKNTTTLNTIASFTGANGSDPDAVTFDAAGDMFGVTFAGGANDLGTVFEIASGTTTIQTVATFNGANGDSPFDSVVFDAAGNLFGTAQSGGANGVGTVFEIASGTTTLQTVASFSGANGNDPSGVTLDAGGNFFGTTFGGGTNGNGTVFKIAKGSSTIGDVFNFNGGNNLSAPQGSVTFDSAGNLFSTASGGGLFGDGAVFEIAKGSSVAKVLDSFNGASNGQLPSAAVTFDTAGNLFGTTPLGGDTHNDGTVFEIANGSSTITTVVGFNNNNGNDSRAAVVFDTAGNLFGTTVFGGANGIGSVFEIVKGSSTITTVASFNGANGSNPRGAVTFDANGNIFGTTATGGSNGAGTVFEIVKGSSTITTVANFNGGNGATPVDSVVFDANGNLFGTTVAGGANGQGTVFEIPSGSSTLQTVVNFNGANGASPAGALAFDAGGNLFGTTGQGGTNGKGTVFEILKGSNSITPVFSFNGTNGTDPEAGVTFDASGNIWGTTQSGGANGFGEVFELTPVVAPPSIVVGGLEFLALNGSFTTNGGISTTTGAVRVGFDPGGGAFVPLITLAGTTSVDTSSLTFSATGAVSAVIGGTTTELFHLGLTGVSIPSLLGGGVNEAGATTFSAAGATFTLNSLKFRNTPSAQIQLQGSLALPHGITIAVNNPNVVTISAAGISLTGATFSLTNSISVGGATFSADNLTVAYTAAGNLFTITGTASVAVSGIANLSVNFTGTGLVIHNGAFVSLDANVSGSFTVGGVDFAGSSLDFSFSESTQAFGLVGGASLTVGNAKNLTVNFTKPGLVITSGTLTSLSATVTGNFTVNTVAFTANNLTFNYTASPQSFSLTGGASVAVGGVNNLAVNFTSPGLVITGGDLTSLSAAVTGTFKVGGVSFAATGSGLNFSYTSSPQSFAMTGDAALTVGGIANLKVHFAPPGLVITTGVLTSLNMSASGSFTVGGVTITPTGGSFTYVAGVFSLLGSATVSFTGLDTPATVAFGHGTSPGPVTPGLVITNTNGTASLTSLDLTLNGAFQISKVKVDATGLEFKYSGAAGAFSLAGSAAVTIKGVDDSITATFGHTNNGVFTQGLVIQGGTLQSLDLTVTGSFHASKVAFTANDLEFIYAAPGTFKLAGSAAVNFAGLDNAFGVTFGHTTNGVASPGLVVSDGNLETLDLNVNSSVHVSKVTFTLTNAEFKYQNTSQTFNPATNTFTGTYDPTKALFSMSGSAMVAVAGIDNSFGVDFGHTANGVTTPGLVIFNGNLESLDVTVNATIKVSKVSFTLTNVEFKYVNTSQTFNPATNTFSGTYDATKALYSLSGSAMVAVAGIDSSFSVAFGHTANGVTTPGLVVFNGNLESLDVTVNATIKVSKVSFTLANVEFKYVNTSQTFNPATNTFTGTYDASKALFTMEGSATVAVAGIDDSFGVSFSHTANNVTAPGLVISNGNLETLDLTVNATVHVAKVKIVLADVEFKYINSSQTFNPVTNTFSGTYDPTKALYSLGGSATVTVAGIDDSFSVSFGHTANGVSTPGLVIFNGNLEILDVSVSATIHISKVTFTLTNVEFKYVNTSQTFNPATNTFTGTYDASAATYSFFGTAGVAVGLNSFSVTFGHGTTPGLEIKSGVLTKLDMTINANFVIDGILNVSVKNLEFSYVAASSKFAISGGAGVSPVGLSELASLDVTFGDTAHPGIVIDTTHGSLVSLGMTVDAHFGISQVQFTGHLALDYTASDSTITISGDAMATIAGIGNANVHLGTAAAGSLPATKGLVIKNGTITQFDMKVDGTFSVAGLAFNANLVMLYTGSTHTFTMTGSATFTVASIGMVNVTLGGASGGGTKGLVVVNGQLQTLNMSVAAAFSFGPVELSGSLFVEYLSDSHGNRFAMYGGGNLKFFSVNVLTETMGTAANPGLVISNGSLQSLNMSATGGLTVLGVQLASISLAATYNDTTKAFTFTGSAGLTLPSFVPDWLAADMGAQNRVIASLTMKLVVIQSKPADSFVELLATLAGGTFGFKVDFNGHITFEPASNPVAVVLNVIDDAWSWFSSWFGPVEGATVFYDPAFKLTLNTDPHVTTGGTSGVSPTNGQFLNVVPAKSIGGQLVMTGGTDVSTGLPNHEMLTAPFDSRVISPLTTLVNQVMQQRNLSESDANTVVDHALNIPDNVILEDENLPLEALGGDKVAMLAFAKEVEIAALVDQVDSLLSGLPGAPSVQTISQNAYAAIATVIGQSDPASLNLADQVLVKQIVQQAAVNSNVKFSTKLLAGLAMIDAAANTVINKLPTGNITTYLNTLLETQFVMESTISPQFKGITQAQMTALVTKTTPAAILAMAQAKPNITDGPLNSIGTVVSITPLEIATVGASAPTNTMTFEVYLSSPKALTVPVTVHFATKDQTATVANGDYTATSGTITWLPGDTSIKTITVKVAATQSIVAGRFFTVQLSNPTNARLETTLAAGSIVEETRFPTTTVLKSSSPSTAAGQAVTFTATVADSDPVKAPIQGNVSFFDGTVLLGIAPVVNGVATLTTSDLDFGAHPITAAYEGGSLPGLFIGASKSAALTQTITRTSQTIKFGPLAKVTEFVPVVLNASASSDLPVTYKVVSGPASVVGNVLTFTGTGTVVIAAAQAGNPNFTPAAQVTQSFVVSGPPIFNGPLTATFTTGVLGTFHVVAGGLPTGKLVEAGTLPTGVIFDPITGLLKGTPAAGTAGNYLLTFTAGNSLGTTSQTFVLNIV